MCCSRYTRVTCCIVIQQFLVICSVCFLSFFCLLFGSGLSAFMSSPEALSPAVCSQLASPSEAVRVPYEAFRSRTSLERPALCSRRPCVLCRPLLSLVNPSPDPWRAVPNVPASGRDCSGSFAVCFASSAAWNCSWEAGSEARGRRRCRGGQRGGGTRSLTTSPREPGPCAGRLGNASPLFTRSVGWGRAAESPGVGWQTRTGWDGAPPSPRLAGLC